MKGLIFVNAYKIPGENIHQAERLKQEFNSLGVSVDIIFDGWKSCSVSDNKIINGEKIDFAVYLDKDKYLSFALESSGVRLFNPHQSVRVCDDKGETVLALANKGINMPSTMFAPLCYSRECVIEQAEADAVINKIGLPVVVKESYGSMGKGVRLASTKEELLVIMDEMKLKPHIYQEYISKNKGEDIRLIVIGGKVVASMLRKNKNDFRSNIAQGGTGEKFTPPAEFIDTAEKVAKLLNLDYCGVDLLVGKDEKPYLCEVNSNAFIKGIESVTGVNVAKAYAEYIIKVIGN